MFCSTIIPTVGRPTLARAVLSVLSQEFQEAPFEVLVVNDSGQALATADWQESALVQIINTNRRERSVARNIGAAVAQGEYLHFLDDDDWLQPDALRTLWQLTQTRRDADWLYGSTALWRHDGSHIIDLHYELDGNCFVQVMAGEWVPLQASLIRSTTFYQVGGFNTRIAGPEDIDLLRRILLYGDIAGTTSLVAGMSWRTENSTTDYQTHQSKSLTAREQILETSGVFGRMRRSATAPRWQGRVVRAYLTSFVWNLRRRRIMDALGRGFLGLCAGFLSLRAAVSPEYWRAILKGYDSEAFARGEAAIRRLAEDPGDGDD